MSYYYKDANGALRARSPQWEYEKYGLVLLPDGTTIWDGLGDGIGRSALGFIAYGDWDMADYSVNCLISKQRWYPEDTPKSVPGKKRFRSIKSLTLDPYIMTSVAHVLNGVNHTLQPPWWVNRAWFRNWCKYIETREEKYLHKYERLLLRKIRWGVLTEPVRLWILATRYGILRRLRHFFGMNAYSIALWSWTAFAAKSTPVKQEVIKHTYPENLLMHALCNPNIDTISIFDHSWAELNFVDREMYPWDKENFDEVNTRAILPDTDRYRLGRDVLYKVLCINFEN